MSMWKEASEQERSALQGGDTIVGRLFVALAVFFVTWVLLPDLAKRWGHR